MLKELKQVEEILEKYKITHDDNLLSDIINIEKNIKVEEFINIKSNNELNNKSIILFLILILILIILF